MSFPLPWSIEEKKYSLQKIGEIIRKVAAIIHEAENLSIESRFKSNAQDPVTEYDIRIQAELERELSRLLPEAGFLGEENDAQDIEGKSIYFVVDPIDGTSNFIADYRHSGISVALVYQEADRGRAYPILAAVYNPYLDELFSAIYGEGAFLNDRKIQVADRELADALLLFGTSPYRREYAAQTFTIAKELFLLSRDIRRGGAAVLDLSYVACGRAELFFEFELKPWDFAAAALIAEEAGAVVSDAGGNPLSYTRASSIVVGSKRHHATALEVIRKSGVLAD